MKPFLNKLARTVYRQLRAHLLHRLIPKSNAQFPEEEKPVIEVIGFFQSISGIGESARLCAQQLAADGYRVKCVSVEAWFRKPVEIAWHWPANDLERDCQCRIFHLNPPMLPTAILQMGIKKFRQTYNIGYWAWELEIIPREWVNALNYMNAIFTPSTFTTNVIQGYTRIPVLTVTHPVATDAPTAGIRGRLGIDEDAFLISNIFSFGSAMERKNPQALVHAFTQAFSPDDRAYLILKANSGADSTEKQQLLALMSLHPNIQLIDQNWSRADILGLLHTSDIYASLHRSEGFGLTIAEAMLLDTPTLVTAWSGNMDFCNQDNSFLVPYHAQAVCSAHPEFNGLTNAHWAEADANAAAQWLKKIFLDSALASSKGKLCAQQMRDCIAANKYQFALEKLGLYKNSGDTLKTPVPIRL